MRLLHPDGIGCAPVHSRVRYPADSATLIARARLRLAPGGTAAWIREMTTTTGDAPYPDDEDGLLPPRYEGDYTPFKPAADALLVGHFHARDGRPVRRSRVSFGVGTRDVVVAVSGKRFWNVGLLRSTATEPEPFDRLELRWDYAFGGPEYEPNPVGRGHVTKAAKKSGTPIELPRIEWPDALVDGPRSTPHPAGLGPRSRTTGERREMLGTFDDAWLEHRWPAYPEDLDLRHFQAAVPELQIRDYLAGDETLWFENLHPDHPEYETRLPGITVVGGVRRIDRSEVRVEVVPMHLDTLWVDMDAEEAVLVWRGLTPTADPDFSDLEYVCFDVLEASEDRSERAVTDRMRAAIQADIDAWSIEEEPPPAVEDEAPPADPGPSTDGADEPEDGETLTDEEREVFAPLLAAGVNPKAPPPEPTPEQTAQYEAMLAKVPEPPDPEEDADAEPAWDRERLRAALQDGTLPPGEDLTGIDLEGESLVGADLAGRILAGARLGKADLTDADLRGAVLAGADLGEARLIRTRLGEADLTGATARAVVATEIDLTAANGAGSDWEGSDLSSATLADADLQSANFRRAVLRRADLAGADLRTAVLEDADLSEVAGPNAEFGAVSGARVRFAEARLASADFSGATLTGACFDRTDLSQATFEDVKADGASFVGCAIDGMRAAGTTDFSGASFDEAAGADPIFEGANLAGATFRSARIPGADFTACVGRDVEFEDCSLKGARFARADLEGARLVRCDCFEASFEAARLDDVDGSQSSFYAAEFLDAETARFHGRDRYFAMSKLADRPDERGRR